jgi:hypothetical protein
MAGGRRIVGPAFLGLPLPSNCALAGSLSTIFVSGRSLRSTRATPATVPPVP